MPRISYLVFIFLFVENIRGNEDENLHLLQAKSLREDNKRSVFIRVYYESQCPDSRNFVVRQLQPTIALLHDYIDLELIPFGKAYSVNKTLFSCQHGPSECRGNMVQACTLNVMGNRADVKRLVDYVACELLTEAGAKNSMQCVKKSGANVGSVEQCLINGEGYELMRKNEVKTKKLRPKFIPTITFDGIFDQTVQNLAMVNLIRTMCSYFNYSVMQCRLKNQVVLPKSPN